MWFEVCWPITQSSGLPQPPMQPMMHSGAPPEYLAHSHQVPGLMGSWNGIEEHGMVLTKGYDRTGGRLFPYSWNRDVSPGMWNTEQCTVCEMLNSELYDETGEFYIVPMDDPSSDWKRWATTVGEIYYYNIKMGQSTWDKPAELMTPLERADASTEWTEFCTPEGLSDKATAMLIPDELKVARELAIKAANQDDGETAVAIIKSTSVDLELGDEDEKKKETKQEYTLLCDWVKQQLGDKVAKVQISKRLSSSPCVVSGKVGWSANMERLMKAQTFGDTSSLEFTRGRRIFEINPDHPIVKDLNAACKKEPESTEAKRAVELLYETALINIGYTTESPAELIGNIYEMMAIALFGRWGRSYTEEAEAAAGETSTTHLKAR